MPRRGFPPGIENQRYQAFRRCRENGRSAMKQTRDNLLSHARELGEEADAVILEAEELMRAVEETIARSEAQMERIREAAAREALASSQMTEDSPPR